MAVTTINIDSQVLTFANLAAFPVTGTVKTIYIAEDTNFQYYWDGSQYELLGSVGTVTSVGLTMPSAFTVTNSPITSSGDIAVTGAGLTSQYIRGDGSLANFPTNGGGGSSVNYYLNGSVNQGTFGGDTYYELSKTPIIGAGTNFIRTNAQGNGYIASFITDAGDPNLLNIPAGNWNVEFYFNASSGGGSPSFYAELYKVSATNVFTLIASGSTNPEGITQGTIVDQYFTSIPVPQTTLLATDRLAIRVYVITNGRNITLHTEDNNLCQVITTFSTGLNALNGLTAQVQNFATGTSGTDFAISSVTDTHTFNLPTASASNRGALSSADWSTFNNKGNGTVTSVAALTLGTSGTDLSSTVANGTTTPVITLNVPTASASNRGVLSSTDWTTFNNKVPTGLITSSGLTMNTARLLGRGTAGSGAVEEIVIGSNLTLTGNTLSATGGGGITIGTTAISSGTVGRVLFEGAGNVVQQDGGFLWNNTDKRLILGADQASVDTNPRLVVVGKNPSGTTILAAFHNSTGNNNALIVRDDTRVGIGTSTLNTTFNLFSQETSRTSAIFDTNQTASGNANAISFRLNNTPTSRISQITTANREGVHVSWDNNLGTGAERGMYIGRDGVQINGINLVDNAVGTIWTRLSGILNSSYSQINVGTFTAIYRDANTIGFGVGNEFHLLNSSNNRVIYGGVGCAITTNTAGSHAGALIFSNAVAGTSAERMRISPTGGLLIGTTTDTPSSILNLTSTTKGFLPPRMTTAQRDLIATPAEGLVIYNTTTQVLNFYNGAVWAAF